MIFLFFIDHVNAKQVEFIIKSKIRESNGYEKNSSDRKKYTQYQM